MSVYSYLLVPTFVFNFRMCGHEGCVISVVSELSHSGQRAGLGEETDGMQSAESAPFFSSTAPPSPQEGGLLLWGWSPGLQNSQSVLSCQLAANSSKRINGQSVLRNLIFQPTRLTSLRKRQEMEPRREQTGGKR